MIRELVKFLSFENGHPHRALICESCTRHDSVSRFLLTVLEVIRHRSIHRADSFPHDDSPFVHTLVGPETHPLIVLHDPLFPGAGGADERPVGILRLDDLRDLIPELAEDPTTHLDGGTLHRGTTEDRLER